MQQRCTMGIGVEDGAGRLDYAHLQDVGCIEVLAIPLTSSRRNHSKGNMYWMGIVVVIPILKHHWKQYDSTNTMDYYVAFSLKCSY
mmetsp:Transcript_22739/g.38938  ORF Transcript_22739/g.38938 Transcript_22739/m.38938 type:complete len:86 (-) Transcript_22739:41-298(-)